GRPGRVVGAKMQDAGRGSDIRKYENGSQRRRGHAAGSFVGFTTLLALLSLFASPLLAQRSQLKPPWNMFSAQTDVQVGKQNAQVMLRRLPLCNDPKVDAYLTQLGLKLVSKLPTHGVQYP